MKGGGVGRGHEGYKHTSSPVLNQVLIIKKDRLLKSSRPFGAQIQNRMTSMSLIYIQSESHIFQIELKYFFQIQKN